MKAISLDLYKYTYRFTNAKRFSYYFALLFMTALHLVVLNGLTLLLVNLTPSAQYIHMAFKFPWFVLPGALLFYINYKKVPWDILSKEKQISPSYSTLIAYIALAGVIITYSHFIK